MARRKTTALWARVGIYAFLLQELEHGPARLKSGRH